jgi:diguanylate cyclase (GGDEF)-like protein
MSEPHPPPRRPLQSLATKVISVVFLATALTAGVVSWISVHSTHAFLERRIQASYPAILERAAERLREFSGEARLELEELAARVEGVEGAEPSRWLGHTTRFDGFALADGAGRVLVRAGDAPWPEVVPAEAREQRGELWPLGGPGAGRLASSAIVRTRSGETLWLHGSVRRRVLAALLASDGLGPAGRILLVGPGDRAVATSQATGEPSSAALSAAALATLADGRVAEYPGRDGQRMVGALRALPGSGLRLLIEEPFEKAFEPVLAVVTRVFVIDLGIILAFSFLAWQVTAAIVKPIEALSEGARRISRGDFDIQLHESDRGDEIGLLTHTFNEMTRKLLGHRAEIEAANHKLVLQNDQLQRANEVLEQLSITDGLTKLHNHRFFQDHLTREIKRVSRTGEPLAMLICDIDDFKRLNDRLGHAAGDELLIGIARVLNDAIREADFLARYGGEEFVVLAPNTELRGAIVLAEKVREAVAAGSYILDSSHQLTKVTVSIGVAQYSGSRKRFFQAADQALYRAKAAGKNCVMAEGDVELPI